MIFKRSATRRNQRRSAGPSTLRAMISALPLRRALPVAVGLLAVSCAVFGVRMVLDRPLTQVQITGRFQRVLPLDVEKAVRSQVGRQGLVTVDLAAVSRAVQQIPWVDQASVARSWPQGLTIQVVEQIPVARWGESGLLNARGELFLNDSRHLPAELPVIAGPPGFEAQMTARYLAVQSRLVEAGMRLSLLQLDERGAWELTLANGVHLRLGRAHVDSRFDRFMLAASRIVAARASEIAYVDLRYSAGFAIGWRPGGGEVTRG